MPLLNSVCILRGRKGKELPPSLARRVPSGRWLVVSDGEQVFAGTIGRWCRQPARLRQSREPSATSVSSLQATPWLDGSFPLVTQRPSVQSSLWWPLGRLAGSQLSFLSTPVGGSSPPCLAPDGPGVPALPFRPLTASLPHCRKPWAWTLNIILSVGPISALAERLQLGPRPQACSRVPPAARGPV